MDVLQFCTPSFVEGHPNSFQLFMIANKAEINITMQVLHDHTFQISWVNI